MSTARHNTSELYSNAQAELAAASSLLLRSEVTRSFRSDRGATLIVKTPEGPKLIIAKKLVIAIPPKTDLLSPFDLDSQEKMVFGKWINGGYWVGIVKNSGFPDDTSITNAVAEGLYNFPPLPQTYSFAPTGVSSRPLRPYRRQILANSTLQGSQNLLTSETIPRMRFRSMARISRLDFTTCCMSCRARGARITRVQRGFQKIVAESGGTRRNRCCPSCLPGSKLYPKLICKLCPQH